MKYDNLAFVIGLVGSALAAPYSTSDATLDGKSEPQTPPAHSSPVYSCSTGRRVDESTCRSLVDRFVADADSMQHRGIPHRRDVHLAAGEETPILTYSANAGDRRFIKLSRREEDGEQKKEDSADTSSPQQMPDWPSMANGWPNLDKDWPKGFPAPGNLDRGGAPAAEIGCTLTIVFTSDMPKNGGDGPPAPQGALSTDLVDHVQVAALELLQNCKSGGVTNPYTGVRVSFGPPEIPLSPQFYPGFGPFDPYGELSPTEHGGRPTPQFGNLPYPPMHMDPGSGAHRQPGNPPHPPVPMRHDNGAHEQPLAEQTGDHSPYPPPDASNEQESAQQAGGLPYPPMPVTHESESDQSPTHTQGGPLMEQQIPEAAHEGATPKTTLEAAPDAGYDDAAHADVKLGKDDDAAESYAFPEASAAGAGLPEKMQAGHSAAPNDIKPAAQPVSEAQPVPEAR